MPPVTLPEENWQRLENLQTLREFAFTSTLPIVGPLVSWLRSKFNGISTRWYVRALMQQQTLFNRSVVHELHFDEMWLSSLASQIEDVIARQNDFQARFLELADRLNKLETVTTQTSDDQDAWLIEQDRDTALLIRNLAEVSAQMRHTQRLMQNLDARVARLENHLAPNPPFSDAQS